MSAAFRAHLASGQTTLCRCWAVRRQDGETYGFTDHDRDLVFGPKGQDPTEVAEAAGFDALVFQAGTGLTARNLEQATGLAVDNSEAFGALSAAAINEADIEAGRFDRAEVFCWLVNWADVSQRWLQFRGHFGQIRRAGGAFDAELRGLTEVLNQPMGRIYQKPCAAVLGDRACGFDLTTPGYSLERVAEQVEAGQYLTFAALAGFEPGWFTGGRLSVLEGPAAGLWSWVKRDEIRAGGLASAGQAADPSGSHRHLTLWEPLRAALRSGDLIRLEAGCDKRFATCRLKFDNTVNYQGFPDIPGEDWVMSVPRQSGSNRGGSRR
ncbi:DUF2163 domain-containing protein [Phaeobacter sp.]|uniref:DUF2163 domain-containing protein n=1 Tax=Phaeobacter sp. TaxID=1902409 RepID=UPI0025DA1266|nr:DUF2163 domain-containing protein [Phaeobacter sp.]